MRKTNCSRRAVTRRAASLLLAAAALLLGACAGTDGDDSFTAPDRTVIGITDTAEPTGTQTGADETREVITAPDTLPGIITAENGTDKETDPAEETTRRDVTTTPPSVYVEPVRLSFIGMGDNIIYGSTFRQSDTGGGKYDFKPKYKGVASMIADADIAFVNQETPMCGEKYGYYTYPQFNTPQDMGRDLVTLGFDVITFANNHMADMGYNGRKCLSDMMDFTDTLDAFVVGLYRNFEDFENIRVYEREGVRIAFLAYTYGTNLYKKQTEPEKLDGVYIPVFDEETIERQVKAAREISDLIIVSIHWGEEGSFKPTEEQERYAHLMADLGVDVILGHHPHVVQKIEWIGGQNGHKTLCYYSLGNGLNAQDELKNMVGITASFDILKDNHGAWVENASCIPTFSVQTPRYKNQRLILLSDLTDSICEQHHCNVTDQKVTKEKAYKIITSNISGEFLPDYLR